jgi:hypothetical protein
MKKLFIVLEIEKIIWRENGRGETRFHFSPAKIPKLHPGTLL